MDLIISCASFKERLIKDFYFLIYNQVKDIKKDINVKFVLNIYKKDYKYITDNLKKIIENGEVELILSDINLKSHNKYYHVMLKYKDVPIITIDDDVEYFINDLLNLYRYYLNNKNIIVCNCSKTIQKDKFYVEWLQDETSFLSKDILPIGIGGILYPPNILNITQDDLPIINDYIMVDDIFLKYKELLYNILCYTFGKKYPNNLLDSKETPQLCYINMKYNNDVMLDTMFKQLNKQKI